MSQLIYLCRHGETEWNRDRKLQGQLDSPLTENGQQQAQALADKARQWQIETVVSSHLGRAKHTAAICAEALKTPHVVYPDLCERNFGDWQGKKTDNLPAYQTFKEYRYTRPELMPDNGGESANMVVRRLLSALEKLVEVENSERFLIVSHGDAMACLAQTFSKGKRIDNCSGFLLRWQANQLHWQSWLD